jgi:hypothetical protein
VPRPHITLASDSGRAVRPDPKRRPVRSDQKTRPIRSAGGVCPLSSRELITQPEPMRWTSWILSFRSVPDQLTMIRQSVRVFEEKVITVVSGQPIGQPFSALPGAPPDPSGHDSRRQAPYPAWSESLLICMACKRSGSAPLKRVAEEWGVSSNDSPRTVGGVDGKGSMGDRYGW